MAREFSALCQVIVNRRKAWLLPLLLVLALALTLILVGNGPESGVFHYAIF